MNENNEEKEVEYCVTCKQAVDQNDRAVLEGANNKIVYHRECLEEQFIRNGAIIDQIKQTVARTIGYKN